MSQRLGEWWRASQQRSDPRTLPAWRLALYATLQAAGCPVQASAWKTSQTSNPDPEALRAALTALYGVCRRG